MPIEETPFVALGTALLRAPVHPLDGPPNPAGTAGNASRALDDVEPGARDEDARLRASIRELTADPLVAEALALSSPSLDDRLAAVLDGRPIRVADLRRSLRAVLRYRVRMSHRSTPFGLMAGVAQARFADTASVRLGDEHRKSVQPDAAWLAGLAARWELRPAILAGLRLSANSLCVRRGDRLVLDYLPGVSGPCEGREEPADSVSVRCTKAVEAVLDAAREPVGHAALTARMRAVLPDAPTGAIEGVISELVSHGMLLTDLPPAPGSPEPLRELTGRLASIPAAAHEVAAIREVAADLARYADCPPGEGLKRLRTAVTRMRALSPCDRPVTADLALDADITLPFAVAREVERACALLWRTGPPPGSRRPLAAYHREFVRRYGYSRPVLLPELLDLVGGLGPPDAQPPAAAGDGLRERTLMALAQQALLDGGDVVLTDRDIDALTDTRGTPPASAEAVFHLLAPTEDALARGDFTLVLSPLTGTSPAGSLRGRFAALLPGADQAFAQSASTALAGRPEDTTRHAPLPAQLLFRPRHARSGNVVRVPRLLPHTIAPGTFAERSGPGALAADELAVVADPARLRLVSLRHDGREVAAATFHMLDTDRFAPVHVHLLQLLTQDAVRPLHGWDWGAARDGPYLPGVRHGRTVLSRPRWLVHDGEVLDPQTPHPSWQRSLRTWQQRWHVPDRIEVGAFDQHLALDLTRPADLRLFRRELRRNPETAVLAPVDPDGTGTGWLTGPRGGHHNAEICVPLLRRAPAAPPARPVRPPSRHPHHAPGGEWLYATLDCPGPQQDTVLTRHLAPLLRGLPSGIDRWFYVRYADSRPHLRLRLHGRPQALTGRVLPALHALADHLRGQGLASRLVLDTYEPELERYGGPRGIAAAERVFHADSVAALAQLRLSDSPAPTVDPVLLTAAGQAHLAQHFAPTGAPTDGPERAARLLALAPRDEYHRFFRDRRREAVLVVDPFGDFPALRALPDASALLTAWARRSRALTLYRELLRREGQDTDDVLASLLHMHHNRVTADPAAVPERTVRAIARGAVETHINRRRALPNASRAQVGASTPPTTPRVRPK